MTIIKLSDVQRDNQDLKDALRKLADTAYEALDVDVKPMSDEKRAALMNALFFAVLEARKKLQEGIDRD